MEMGNERLRFVKNKSNLVLSEVNGKRFTESFPVGSRVVRDFDLKTIGVTCTGRVYDDYEDDIVFVKIPGKTEKMGLWSISSIRPVAR